MDEPDTYGGAKYVSRANEVARPHPSGGDLYGLPRAVDPMLLRSLEQRQNQTPMRFFEAGTHGQRFDKVKAMSNYQKGTLGQVGAEPGLARKVLGTPSARQAAVNRGLHPQHTTSVGHPITRPVGSADCTSGVLDDALGATPLGKAVGWGQQGVERGPRLQDTAYSLWMRGEKRPKESKPAAPRTNAPQD